MPYSLRTRSTSINYNDKLRAKAIKKFYLKPKRRMKPKRNPRKPPKPPEIQKPTPQPKQNPRPKTVEVKKEDNPPPPPPQSEPIKTVKQEESASPRNICSVS